MIVIRGVLKVKEYNGKNGRFCTGDLQTSIGSFKVKEAILEQFEEGMYEGEFFIEQVFLSAYIYQGRSMTDIRARVTDIHLDSADEGNVADELTEPDPTIDESVSNAPSTQVVSQKINTVEAQSNEAEAKLEHSESAGANKTYSSEVDSELSSLFGEELALLVHRGDKVKLDPTVDRPIFAQQRTKLKALGYRFNALEQTWCVE